MRKANLLKMFLVLIMGVVLFAMSINVFAADDIFLDITNTVNTNSNTNTNTNTNTNVNTNTNSNSNTNVSNNVNVNYNTNLPATGIESNAMLGIVFIGLIGMSIYAYKKVKYYNGI